MLMDFIDFISQGSVATQLRCGGMFNNHFIAHFATECASEKIGQYLAKIWTNVCGLLFGTTLYMYGRTQLPIRIKQISTLIYYNLTCNLCMLQLI